MGWGTGSEPRRVDRGLTAPRQRVGCALAPPGWLCTRDHGHKGPCAAIPTVKQGNKFTFSAAGITIDAGLEHPTVIDWQRIDEMRARFGPKS